MKRLILTEEEKNEIQSQHDEIDRQLMTFLLRRFKKEDRKLGDFDDKPLIVTEYTFEGYPGYGFNSFPSKKDMEKKLINMLYENNILENHPYDLDQRDPKRVRLIKTLRKFLDFVITK